MTSDPGVQVILGVVFAGVLIAVVVGLVSFMQPAKPPVSAVELPPTPPPAPVVEVRTEIQRVEVPAPDPLAEQVVYIRVDWKAADSYLRGLDEFGGSDGYTREFLVDAPRFLSSSYAGEPFFLWRRDFYLKHRSGLGGK